MAVYVGGDECRVIYVAKNGQQLRVSSVWVGDKQVFPPANRQEVHVFTRDTQGYERVDYGAMWGFSVPVPWWATSADVVIIGAGEKGRDGTKDFLGGKDGDGGRSGAWVVKTVALNPAHSATVTIGKGTSTAPAVTSVVMYNADGHPAVKVDDTEGTRTPNSGAIGGYVTPQSRTEFDNSHVGGYGGSRNNPGTHPGGGGGGGQGSNLLGNPRAGQPGGDGYVWLRFRSATALSPGDEGFILRVGVASGYAYAPLRQWAMGIGKTYLTITEITVPMEVIGPSLQSLFDSCSSLVGVPDFDTSQVTNMAYMFYGCSSLTSIPDLDTSQVMNMNGMFNGCRALTSVPELNTSQVTDTGYMFANCQALTSVPALDTGQATDIRYMFYNCSSLESVTLPGMGNGFTTAQTLDMRDTKLSVAAANALIHSLGTPTPGGTLHLPATAAGAATDASIAEAKNWRVTFG